MSTAVNPLTAISTWSIDPAHSSVHFKVRHMTISNVRGEFDIAPEDRTQIWRSPKQMDTIKADPQ